MTRFWREADPRMKLGVNMLIIIHAGEIATNLRQSLGDILAPRGQLGIDPIDKRANEETPMDMTSALDPLTMAIFTAVGVAAGFLNVVAGGGSLLIVPLMIFWGIPPTVANGTSRLGILVQNISAATHYYRAGRLDMTLFRLILPPALIGVCAGAWAASYVSDAVFQQILAWIMLAVAVLVVVNPSPKAPVPGHGDVDASTLARRRAIWVWPFFLAIGFYGGMIQAGVGFILLAGLTQILRLDLVTANIMKIMVVGAYMPIAIAIFLWQGKVNIPFAIMACIGQALGGWLGAKATLKQGEPLIRLLLGVATVLMALKLLHAFNF